MMLFHGRKRWAAIILYAAFLLAAMGTESPARAYVTHTVREGDSLFRIAAHDLPYADSYTGEERIGDISALNALSSSMLSAGQGLAIPVARSEPVRAAGRPKAKDFAARGIYVNEKNAGTGKIFDLARRLKSSGENTVVFDVKETQGTLSYRSSIPGAFAPVSSCPYSIEDISKLICHLHRMDVHVVARVCVFRDRLMASSMESWRYSEEWVDPANEDVQQYNLALIRELIGLGVGEIQLDYFRYPADGRTDTGVEGKDRSDILAEYLARIHDLTSAGKVLLSLDMFGIVIWQRSMDVSVLGQDVQKIVDHVDIISPMLYPSHFGKGFDGIPNPADEPYYFVREGVQRLKNIVGDRVAVRPWLQSFPLKITAGFDPEYVRCQIDAARDAGAAGWLLWSPGNRYDEAFAAIEDMHVAKMAGEPALQEEEQGGSVQGPDANWHFEKCLTPGLPGWILPAVDGPAGRLRQYLFLERPCIPWGCRVHAASLGSERTGSIR